MDSVHVTVPRRVVQPGVITTRTGATSARSANEDVERFPESAISDVHRRIGPEIPPRTIKHAFDLLLSEGAISTTGERRWRRYGVNKPIDQGGPDGR